MGQTLLHYPLHNGWIDHWLAAGPLVVAEEAGSAPGFFRQEPPVTPAPVDLGSLGAITEHSPAVRWGYMRCREDHLVDWTAVYPTRAALCGWAYAQLWAAQEQGVKLHLAGSGPMEAWLNGAKVWDGADWPQAGRSGDLRRATVEVMLRPGANELLARLAGRGSGPVFMALAVRVEGPVEEITLPTEIEPEYLETRERLEQIVEGAYLDRYVYGYPGGDRLNRNEPITLRFADELRQRGEITLRMQSPAGDIYQEVTKEFGGGSVYELAKTFPLYNGAHHLALLPPAKLYYTKKLRFERRDLFYVVRSPYSSGPYGSIEQRRAEALRDAAGRRNSSLYCQIARIATGDWGMFERKHVERALERVRAGQVGSEADLLGLLGLLVRFGEVEAFPTDLKSAIEAAVVEYDYSGSVPEDGASRAILLYACAILAGQRFGGRVFPRSGQSGQQHRERGEAQAAAWMQERGRFGLEAWDAPEEMEAALAALAHLVDLAENERVVELAAALMDKLFFSLALNDFAGVFGGAQGRAASDSVLSGRLQSTGGIARLMWGAGCFTEHLMGTVSLALCQNYELPGPIARVAAEPQPAVWARRHYGPAGEGQGVDLVSYRTADFMLSSAQDYRPGQPGRGEHIWQATLGPDAVVFTNHPACMREDGAHRPDLWAGNGRLPRAAQWGDALIVLYRLTADDWLGFTHAYFPAAAFDEHHFEGQWALARKGRAYLALYASGGFEWITRGPTAFRELRAYGERQAWVCQMGHELLDGSFENFRQKVLGLMVETAGDTVRFTSLRGEAISFGWEQPLVVNGEVQPLHTEMQFETPYCQARVGAANLEIVYQGEGIRLNFE